MSMHVFARLWKGRDPYSVDYLSRSFKVILDWAILFIVFVTNLMPNQWDQGGQEHAQDNTHCELQIDMDLKDYELFYWKLKAIIWVKKTI